MKPEKLEIVDIQPLNVLYHGTSGYNSDIIFNNINNINFDKLDNNADFGKGFYLSLNKEQAEEWARIVYNKNRPLCNNNIMELAFIKAIKKNDDVEEETPFLISYPFAYDKILDCNYHVIPNPDREWLQFIFQHRHYDPKDTRPCKHEYDFMYGYIADGSFRKLTNYFKKEYSNLTDDDLEFIHEVFLSNKDKTYTQISIHNLRTLQLILNDGKKIKLDTLNI